MSKIKNHIKDSSTTLSTNFEFPKINDIIQWIEIKNQTGSNDDRIPKLQSDKDSRDIHSKALDDLLKYTFEIRRSNNPERYSGWKATIERVVEKIYGSVSIELKQIKSAIKLNFLTTSGQSEEQRGIYFSNLYEKRFNRIEQLINDFKLDQINPGIK